MGDGRDDLPVTGARRRAARRASSEQRTRRAPASRRSARRAWRRRSPAPGVEAPSVNGAQAAPARLPSRSIDRRDAGVGGASACMRPVSSARVRAICRCCAGASESPNQATLDTFTSSVRFGQLADDLLAEGVLVADVGGDALARHRQRPLVAPRRARNPSAGSTAPARSSRSPAARTRRTARGATCGRTAAARRRGSPRCCSSRPGAVRVGTPSSRSPPLRLRASLRRRSR